jgi:hypothetical protein
MHERRAVVASSKAFGAFAHVTVSERAAPYQRSFAAMLYRCSFAREGREWKGKTGELTSWPRRSARQ